MHYSNTGIFIVLKKQWNSIVTYNSFFQFDFVTKNILEYILQTGV